MSAEGLEARDHLTSVDSEGMGETLSLSASQTPHLITSPSKKTDGF